MTSHHQEAQALTAKREAGGLTHQQLEVAAYLGHAPAQVALGRRPQPPIDGWASGLIAWGKEPLVRAAVACGLWGLPLPLGEDLRPMEDVLETALLWAANQTEASRVAARIAHDELVALRAQLEAAGEVSADFAFELDVADAIAQVASDSRGDAVVYHFTRLLERVGTLPDDESAECLDAVRASLLAWALDQPDPLRA